MAGLRPVELRMLFLTLSLYLGSLAAQDEVVTKQGIIRGTTHTTRGGRNITAFLGIPYAQPPVGPLRFKNTVPADSWNGTFIADTDGNQCPQLDEHDVPIGDEDCLYLNVYTPQVNSSALYPTMVYIHGGDFVRGNGTSSYAGPGYIMDRDVVLVAMNYRLGVLGFLSTGDAEAPGNFGLKDQVVALRWVQDNIKAFSGDPEKVTIFGQSAGAVSVNLHVLSDLSEGLFHQYIAHSGSSLCFWAFQEISTYRNLAFNLGEYLNCPTNNSQILIDCLREVDVYSVINSNGIFEGILKFVDTWVPTNEPDLEGAFMTMRPIDRMLKNKMKDYPSISGDVSDEGLVVSGLLFTNSTMYDEIASDIGNFLLSITNTFLEVDDAEDIATNVVDFYFRGIDYQDKYKFIQSVTDVITDTAFLFPTIAQLQIQMLKTKSPLYYYSFDYRGTISKTIEMTGTNDNVGVTHTDDLIYLFPSTPANYGYPNDELDENDELVINYMVDFWTSFAYNGKPTSNHTSNPDIWQPYDPSATYLRIGHNTEPSLTLLKNFQEKRMRFWLMRLLHTFIHIG